MTVRKARSRLPLIVLVVLAAGLSTLPVRADTASDLASAKKRAAQIRAELDQATAVYQEAVARYSATQDRITTTQENIARKRTQLATLRRALSRRARQAYEQGAGNNLELLLSSGSFAEFSDRAVFLDRLSQDDSDLVLRTQVAGGELARQVQDLQALSREQAATAVVLRKAQAAIDAKYAEAKALQDKLQKELDAEQAVRIFAPGTIVQGGALQACPAPGASFSDDFGDPRPGGRVHQGNDMFAPRGSPVVAAQSGSASQHANDLGGNAVIVTAANGDYTYYAHLDSYGASGSVSAGTQIGTVGNSGNASGGPTHLHFEYHPGGGGAVDPYPYLRAVCG